MTTWAESQLDKQIRKQSEYEAKGLPLPRELTDEYLEEHYQLSRDQLQEHKHPDEHRHG